MSPQPQAHPCRRRAPIVAVPTVVGSPNILSPLKKLNTIMLNLRLDPLIMWPIRSRDVDDPAAGPRPVVPFHLAMVVPGRRAGRAPPILPMEDRRRPRPRPRPRDVYLQEAVAASRSRLPRRLITQTSGPRLEVGNLSIIHLRVVTSGSLVKS